MNSIRQLDVRGFWRAIFALAALVAMGSGRALAQRTGDANLANKGEQVAADPAIRKEEAWRKSWPSLMKAESDSLAAVDEVIKDVGDSFERADVNIPPFVEDVLSISGKFQLATEGAMKAVDGIFGSTLKRSQGPDTFDAYVRSGFVKQVFDPEAFKRGVVNAAKAYVTRLTAADGRMLVELRADIPDGEIRLPKLGEPQLARALLTQVDAAVDDSIRTATTDLSVSVGKFLVSEVSGNLISNRLFSGAEDDGEEAGDNQSGSGILGFVGGLLIGQAMDVAIDAAAKAAGYDAEKQLADTVRARIKRAREAVIDGEDEGLNQDYVWFAFLRQGHPDAEVRSMCARAADHLEANSLIGLRPLLQGMHCARLSDRRLAVYRACLGDDAIPPADLSVNPDKAPKRDAILRSARRYLAN